MFDYLDFDSMRNFLWTRSGKISEREARLAMFDFYRYEEDYESIYNMIKWYGGILNFR